MKVILNQDVIGLGEEGDIKDVADGYARNFLLPKKLAVPHTKQFLVALEHKRSSIEKRKEEKRLEASSLKERLEAEGLPKVARLLEPARGRGIAQQLLRVHRARGGQALYPSRGFGAQRALVHGAPQGASAGSAGPWPRRGLAFRRGTGIRIRRC